MVRKRRLQAEKGRHPPYFCVCPFRSHTVINYTAQTGAPEKILYFVDATNQLIPFWNN